jgi:hypothetical protein
VQVTPGHYAGHFLTGEIETGPYVLVTDRRWWNMNFNDIVDWLDQTGVSTRYKSQSAMAIGFNSNQELAMFVLRWGTA